LNIPTWQPAAKCLALAAPHALPPRVQASAGGQTGGARVGWLCSGFGQYPAHRPSGSVAEHSNAIFTRPTRGCDPRASTREA